MSIALDIIVAVILIFSILGAYKKGFIKTFIDMVGTIASLIIAYFIATPVGNFINNICLQPIFSKTLDGMLVKNGVSTSGDGLLKIVEDSPEFLNNILTKFNTTLDTVIANVSKSSSDFASDFINAAISPVSKTTSYVIAFIIIFIVCSIVISILSNVAGLANKIPILGSVNRLLGLFLGVINGLLVVFVFIFIFSSVIPYLQSMSNSPIDANIIQNTFIYKYFDLYNPISALFK